MVGNDRDKQKDRETSMGPGAHTLQRNPQAAAAPEELRLGRTRVLSFWFSSISLSSCISHSMEGGGFFHFLRVGGVGSQGGNFAQKGSSCYILGQPLPMAKEASGTWHGLRKLQQSHDRKGSRRCLPVGGTLQRRWCHSPGDLCCPNSGSHWS